MRFFKWLLFFIIKLVIVVIFVWLFLATFWFKNTWNPATVYDSFFSPYALGFVRGNAIWPIAAPQLIANASVLGQIGAFHDFIASSIGGPIWASALVMGYVIPFGMGLIFGGICLGILMLIYRFFARVVFKRPSKKSKRKGRYDKYDDSKKRGAYADRRDVGVYREERYARQRHTDQPNHFQDTSRRLPQNRTRPYYDEQPYGYPQSRNEVPYGYERDPRYGN